MSDPKFFLKSMTAYGRSHAVAPAGSLTVEVHSVNRRYLDITLQLPRAFFSFDIKARKAVGERIGRGMITLSANWIPNPQRPITVIPHLGLAHSVRAGWEKIAEALGLKQETIDLALLARGPELFSLDSGVEEGVEALFLDTLQKALDALIAMRAQEGALLAHDLCLRTHQVATYFDAIAERAPLVAAQYRAKLTSRLAEFQLDSGEKEERLFRDIASYAERIDITEEVVRGRSHLQHMQSLLTQAEGDQGGKRLDFLLQELHRETTTIGSKAADLSITQWVILIKGEIEKMREQVQNIE